MKSAECGQVRIKERVLNFSLCFCFLAILFQTRESLMAESKAVRVDVFPKLKSYLQQRQQEFDQISFERKGRLQDVANYVSRRLQTDEPARLTFICTHNSRRSHLSQVWAATAADYYGFANVETFSGGTEATALNLRTAAAMERAGFEVKKLDDEKNPRYSIRSNAVTPARICFSKVYNESPNPKEDFCAVLTCSQADASCPVVTGSSLRIAIPYDDPKVADDTPQEQAKYDERCRQISREMLYLFSLVRTN